MSHTNKITEMYFMYREKNICTSEENINFLYKKEEPLFEFMYKISVSKMKYSDTCFLLIIYIDDNIFN